MALGAVLLVMPMRVQAQSLASPTVSPTPRLTPTASPASLPPSGSPARPPVGTVTWQPVSGPLGGGVPGLFVMAGPPVAWAHGFATLESSTVYEDNGRPTVQWTQPAIWRSADGSAWSRSALPVSMVGVLTLVPWLGGLAILEQARRSTGLRFAIWSSADGTHWRRHGDLAALASGALTGCGFTNQQEVSTGHRLVVVASCAVDHGSGGDIGPTGRTIGSAASSRKRTHQGVPTYAWSSADGHRWTRRLVARTTDTDGFEARLWSFSSFSGGVTGTLRSDSTQVVWSPDGITWSDIGPLPLDGDIRRIGVDAVPGVGGRPGTWLVVAQPGASLADPSGLTHETPHLTLWTRTGSGPWIGVWGEDGWEGAATVVAGDTVTVVMSETLDAAHHHRLWTLVSTDGALTWTLSPPDGTILPDCAIPSAGSGQEVVMRCTDGSDIYQFRHATVGL